MAQSILGIIHLSCIRQILYKLLWCCSLSTISIVSATDALAQPLPENPVYIDDSPQAWELFQLAQDQVADNAGEAVRLYQELLDEYSKALLPINTLTDDHYVAVRSRVLKELLSNQKLLDRYRLIESAQAQRMLDAGQLLQLVVTRSVTAPGVEALLQLAQRDTEAARFRAALNWLNQAKNHPDLDDEKAQHCWFMMAMAAHCAGETDLKNHAIETLSFIEDSRNHLGDSLKRMIDSINSLPQQRVISPLSKGEAVDLRELVSQPIWSINLSTTPYAQGVATAGMSFELPTSPYRPGRQPSVELTTAPTIKGNALYINEGRTVRALDRFTGRSLWRKPYVERLSRLSQSRASTKIVDMNIVAVDSGSLVTITGHTLTNSRNPQEANRSIICLDERSGKLRWATKIDRMQGREDYAGLIPHGAPIIAEGAVYVLARKTSRQLLTDCYLISLDLADGQLRWARHIASSGGIRSRAARPYSSPIYHKGAIIIATPIGAVARINGNTGQTKWLRRYAPPLNPLGVERKPWQIGQPAVTPNGVIALSPNEQHVLLLDWDTGEELQRFSAKGRDAWNAPRYFLADEEKVYAVGGQVRVFNVDALEKPIWGIPRPAIQATNQDIPMPEQLEIFGRVQLTDGALVIPTPDEFLVVQVQSGQISQIVPANVAGNPLAAGSQLIVAGNQQLDSYMPLRRAEEMLRQRIAQSPGEPGPALSLLQLGIRAKDLELALEAAELVENATNVLPITEESQSARQELLSMLLEINRQKIAATNQQGEMLHAMIGAVAIEPHQRVEYLLAYGDWLSTHSLARAIEAYQTILSSPELADTPRFEDYLQRPAYAWAAQRLSDLVRDRGLTIYRPQSVFAGMRLDQLIQAEAPAQQYLALAREFPLSQASAQASLLAANLIDTGENQLDVVVSLINAYRLGPSKQRATKLLGWVIARCEKTGWNDSAENVLQFVIDSFGNIVLDSPTGPRDAQNWLGALRNTAKTQLPQIGELKGNIKELDGKVVTTFSGTSTILPNDRILLFDGSNFHLSAALGLETIWSVAFEQQVQPYILKFSKDQLLLWLVATGGDARAMMLNPANNGEVLWNTPWMSQILGDSPLGRGRDKDEAQSQGITYVDPAHCQPLISGQTLTVVRHAGEMVSFDLSNQGQLRWANVVKLPLDRVDIIKQHDFAIAISGTRRSLENAESIGRLILVNPVSGKVICDIKTLDAEPLRWMSIGPLGDLVYGSKAGIQALEISSGQSRWSNFSDAAKSAQAGWPIGEKVIIETPLDILSQRVSPLRSVDIQSGFISREFALPGRGGWDANDLNGLLIIQGHIYAIFSERIVRYNVLGAVDGADSVFGEPNDRNYRWLLPADDRLILVNHFLGKQANRAPGRGGQTQYTYRLYTLSDNCKLIGETVQPPPVLRRYEHARIIDGWILLSSATSTDAIPAPTKN